MSHRNATGATMPRKVADCRQWPSEMDCTLTIAGEEDEVLPVAVHHAITTHKHEDTPELREELRKLLTDEVPAAV